MHILFYAGLDPASQLFGVCWLDGDGNPLAPLGDLSGYVTLKAGKPGKDRRNERLDDISAALRNYLVEFPCAYANRIWQQKHINVTWEIAAFGLESPSDQYHTRGRDGDRHDTSFVNGMSFRMAYETLRGFISTYNLSIPIYEISPTDSSRNLGLSGKSKWQRCSAVAQLGGGRYTWQGDTLLDYKERMKHADHGWCLGGALDGANADALDAGAIAWSARHRHLEANLIQLAKEQSSGPKPTRRRIRPQP